MLDGMKWYLDFRRRNLIMGTLLGYAVLKTKTNGQTWSYHAAEPDRYKDYFNLKYRFVTQFCEEVSAEKTKIFSKDIFNPAVEKHFK